MSAIKDVEGVEICAVCDRDEQRAQEIANLTSGARGLYGYGATH